MLCLSLGLTVVQLGQKDELETASALVLSRNMLQGEVVEASDIVEKSFLPENLPDNRLGSADEVIGKQLTVDVSAGSILLNSFFVEQFDFTVEAGHALTAVRLLPDTAICWTQEVDAEVEVCFVDSEGEMERLGKVVIRGVFDKQMGEDEALMFAVIEGKNNVVDRIISLREKGRIEFVKRK